MSHRTLKEGTEIPLLGQLNQHTSHFFDSGQRRTRDVWPHHASRSVHGVYYWKKRMTGMLWNRFADSLPIRIHSPDRLFAVEDILSQEVRSHLQNLRDEFSGFLRDVARTRSHSTRECRQNARCDEHGDWMVMKTVIRLRKCPDYPDYFLTIASC